MRQQILQLMDRLDVGEVCEDHLDVAGKLPQYLSARPAWRRRLRRVSHHDDALEGTMSLGDGLEDRDALGAHRETVGRVLDIAARDDSPVRRFEGGADLEIRERGHRTL